MNGINYNTINTIQSNLFQLSYMSIIIIIHCIFLNEKLKRICRRLNKLIRDIPRKKLAIVYMIIVSICSKT